MRALKVLFLSIILLSVSSLSFASDPVIKPQTVHNQIQSILTSNDLGFDFNSDVSLKISFIINSNSELIVLSTNNVDMDEVIKTTLNYKKIAINNLEFNEVYTLPITLKKK